MYVEDSHHRSIFPQLAVNLAPHEREKRLFMEKEYYHNKNKM
jgi:hypothetical protein